MKLYRDPTGSTLQKKSHDKRNCIDLVSSAFAPWDVSMGMSSPIRRLNRFVATCSLNGNESGVEMMKLLEWGNGNLFQ